jgi:hypothetical protein
MLRGSLPPAVAELGLVSRLYLRDGRESLDLPYSLDRCVGLATLVCVASAPRSDQ